MPVVTLNPGDLVVTDIDDVLCPFYVHQNEVIESMLGHPIRLTERTTPYLSTSHSHLAVTKQLELETVYATYRSPGFRNALPFPGSQAAINALARKFRVIAMTSRPSSMEQATRIWLEKFFPGCFSDVLIMGLVGTPEHDVTKVEASAQLGAKVMIEDVRHNLGGCSDQGIQGFLVTAPWNRCDEPHPDFVRVNSIASVPSQLRIAGELVA